VRTMTTGLVSLFAIILSMAQATAAPPKSKTRASPKPSATAPPGLDGWANLHWGMNTADILALHSSTKTQKSTEYTWLELEPVSLGGDQYKVEAIVSEATGLIVVRMEAVEKSGLSPGEVNLRAVYLEGKLTLKYGPPTFRGEGLATWKFEKLEINLLWNERVVGLSYADPLYVSTTKPKL
jgi:hypothetical protein